MTLRAGIVGGLTIALLITGGVAAQPAAGGGNFASLPTRLMRLEMRENLTFSVNQYELQTGLYYRWEICGDGGEEYQFKAPGLFRFSWINQIVIEDIEVKPMGGVDSVEFDEEGCAEIFFIPLVPGNYEYYVEGQRERGMLGTIVVR